MLLSECIVGYKSVRSPLPLAHPLYEKKKPLSKQQIVEVQKIHYRPILGSLLYFSTWTCPDIAIAVSMLTKSQTDPALAYWKAMKHLLRYLACTTHYGFWLPSTHGTVDVQAWSDADWAPDHTQRRLRSGLLVRIKGDPIICSSELQAATAESTTEAKFSALAVCFREVKWLRSVLEELRVRNNTLSVVHRDNRGMIAWTTEVKGLRHVKHVGIKCHFVREMVEEKSVMVPHRATSDNKASALTKAVKTQPSRHWKHILTDERAIKIQLESCT